MKKMIMAVVPKNAAELVLKSLIEAGHTATFSESTSGVLRQTQYSLFIAVDEEDLEKVKKIIKDNCRIDVSLDNQNENGFQTMNAGVGGSVVFVWDLISMDIN